MATQTINLTPSNTSSFYIQLVLTDSNVDSVNNKTTLSYSITFVCSSGYYHFNYNNQLRFELNGTQLINTNSVGSINLNAGGTQLLLSGSMDITHEADGSKNVPWYLRFNQPYGSSGVYTAQDSGTFVCERVPRTSSITVSNGTLGTTQTITITKATSNFTSTLRYVCGNTSGTISNTSGTSVSWKPPLTLATQDTRGTSVLCTVYCDTYSGSTLIGTTSKVITLAVPASVKPSVSSTSVAEGNTSVLPAATFSGTYVQGKSRAVVTVKASTANCQGATISSCIVTIGGTAYSASVSNSGTTATCTVTSPTLSATGTVSISATITDTRGRTATGTATSITVYEYSAPKINSFSVFRSDDEGTASDEGTYGTFSASGSYSTVNGKNTYTSKVEYGLNVSGASMTTLTYSHTDISNVIVSGLAADQTYQFIYTVSDRFTSVRKIVIVSTAFYTIDFLSGGHGIAFGKAAEIADYFECNLNSKFNKSVTVGLQLEPKTLFVNGVLKFSRNSDDGVYWPTSSTASRNIYMLKGTSTKNYCVALREIYNGNISDGYNIWEYNADQTFHVNAPLIIQKNNTDYNVSNIVSNFGQKINGNLVKKSITVRTWVTVANVVIPAGISLVSYSVMIKGAGNRLTACLLPDVGVETRSSVYSPDGNSYNCSGTFAITATQEKTMQLQVWSETLTSVEDVRLSAMQLFVQ